MNLMWQNRDPALKILEDCEASYNKAKKSKAGTCLQSREDNWGEIGIILM